MLALIVEAVRAATDRPFNLTWHRTVTLAAITTDKHYGGDIKALSLDVAKAFNAELRDLQERGGVYMVQVAGP